MPKRKHQQQYKTEYSDLWPVLKKSKLSCNHVYCTICNFDFNISHGGKDDCRRHVECNRHTTKAKAVSSQSDLKTLFVTSSDNSVIRAEALFTSFLIEHNVPISAADHAGHLFRKMFPDSKIASKYGCARTKTTAILKSFSEKTVEDTVKSLREIKFSLSTDGSNSTENEKIFPMLVTYFDRSIERNVTAMLALPNLKGECSGENIFKMIHNQFEKLSIPWKNCVSFCSDNASIMTGKFKGVIKFLKDVNPNIVFSGCACHLVHLVAQHSSKKLGFPLEEFLVDVFYFLKKSSKRMDSFKLCQELSGVEVHKILKYGSTRWLSMEQVINRILEQWEALKMFFESEQGQSGALHRIQAKFSNPNTMLYLLFLQSVLPLFTKVNICLQQEAPLIHKLQRELVGLYSECLSRFVKPSAVVNSDNIFEIEFTDKKNQKAKEDLVIGNKTRQFLADSELEETERKQFYVNVRAFYEKACSYMLLKFPLKEELLKHAEILDPSLRAKVKFSSVKYFVNKFNLLDENEINLAESEFALYQCDKLGEEILNCERIDKTWAIISEIEDHNRVKKYKNLAKVMLSILVIPHSNAACERIFSSIRKNQNEFRSRLSRETVESLMIEKCKFASYDLCCFKVNFSDVELTRAKKATYLSNNSIFS